MKGGKIRKISIIYCYKDKVQSDIEVFLNAGTVIILLESCGSNP